METESQIVAEKNGERRTFGVIQWERLTGKGKHKKNEYDGWVKVDNPEAPLLVAKPVFPDNTPPSENELPANEKEALDAMNRSINGEGSEGASFAPKKEETKKGGNK